MDVGLDRDVGRSDKDALFEVGPGLGPLATLFVDLSTVRIGGGPARIGLDRPSEVVERLVHLADACVGDAAVVERPGPILDRQSALGETGRVEGDLLLRVVGGVGGLAGAEVRQRRGRRAEHHSEAQRRQKPCNDAHAPPLTRGCIKPSSPAKGNKLHRRGA